MSASDNPLIAAVEAGGTKFNCIVARSPTEVLESTRIPTTSPSETLTAVCRFLTTAKAKYGAFAGIGVGCFGPVDLNPTSKTYGFITSTPKPGWQNTEVVGLLRSKFKVPVGFDTDVNGAVLGEYLWGNGVNRDPLVYITIGTGVGGGVLINGRLQHGLLHPEIGHMHVPSPQRSAAVMPAGQCPFHKNCVEGFICGPAIAQRWGVRADRLPPDSPAWQEVAEVLAHLCVNLTFTLSPQRIILGGGVMDQPQLLPLVHGQFIQILNGYLRDPLLGARIDEYILPPGLGSEAGIMGALALGRMAANAHQSRV